MFIDKEEEEKKAKEFEKNAITWDLHGFEDIWSFNQAFGKGKLENSKIHNSFLWKQFFRDEPI